MTVNESKVSKLEQQLNPQPEIENWIPVELRIDGMHYRNKEVMTDQEYQELESTPGVGIILIKRIDMPKAED